MKANQRLDQIEQKLAEQHNGQAGAPGDWLDWIDQNARPGELVSFFRHFRRLALAEGDTERAAAYAAGLAAMGAEVDIDPGDSLIVLWLLRRVPDYLQPEWFTQQEAEYRECMKIQSYEGKTERARAWELFALGWSDAEIAAELGLFESTIYNLRVDWDMKNT